MKFLILIFNLLIALQCISQSKIDRSVIGNGATESESSTHKVRGTLGQSVIGMNTNAEIDLKSGFWHQVLQLNTAVIEIPAGTYQETLVLGQNFPNPAKGQTIINFELPTKGQVSLYIYSIESKIVSELHNGELSSGKYQLEVDLTGIPPGVYVYTLYFNQQRLSKTMVLD